MLLGRLPRSTHQLLIRRTGVCPRSIAGNLPRKFRQALPSRVGTVQQRHIIRMLLYESRMARGPGEGGVRVRQRPLL